MKIKQSDLQGGRVSDFTFCVKQQDIADENHELGGIIAKEGMTVVGKAVRINQNEISVKLRITGTMIFPCARCLTPTPYACDYTYDEVLEADQKDESFSLIPSVEECLFINEPFRVLCKEDCKGLCPHCGANLNQTDCQCHDEPELDPRLAALKKLL
ncbi:MAG: YceD family protein [Eubacteriaceae bacterium]|nr:YceD family protein [Eubacteriaceae bacterium]